MNKKEIKKFLSLPLIAKLATVNPDGSPQISPVWFQHDRGAITIATYKEAVKIRNIKRNSNIAVLIDSSNGGLNLTGILMQGAAILVTGPDCKKIEKRIYDKYLPPKITGKDKVAAAFKRLVMSGSGSSICIRFIPKNITAWDYSKMTMKDVMNESSQAYVRYKPKEIFT
jgi:predicted pyridoxine 5'-phosphate oxidase superfamily flavin-nucleotide-binding protein